MDGKKVGEELKAAHQEIFGIKDKPSGIFNGGNPGMIFLASAIEDAGKTLASSMDRMTDAIEKACALDSPVAVPAAPTETSVDDNPSDFCRAKNPNTGSLCILGKGHTRKHFSNPKGIAENW